MRVRTQLIIEDTVMQKIDEIAGEKHLRAKVVETALREYIERYEASPKRKAKVPADPKEKAKAAAIAKAKKTVRARA
jgi:metal-responsive CopG/Arc/MetJ family transcriptional regulator